MVLDNVFAQEKDAENFCFDWRVAGVFDDMVDRSVPFYQEIQRMVGELAKDFVLPGSHLCDLGCATGTTLHYWMIFYPMMLFLKGLITRQRCWKNAGKSLNNGILNVSPTFFVRISERCSYLQIFLSYR